MSPDTRELVQDLGRIEELIALMTRPSHNDGQDADDLGWLTTKRQHLAALLAVRRSLAGQKIVDLELWRAGSVRAPAREIGAA
jgi:hypothetical protein